VVDAVDDGLVVFTDDVEKNGSEVANESNEGTYNDVV
jgi:hypothetical protein